MPDININAILLVLLGLIVSAVVGLLVFVTTQRIFTACIAGAVPLVLLLIAIAGQFTHRPPPGMD